MMDHKLHNLFDTYKNASGSTIIVLQKIQEIYKYLPENILAEMSKAFHMSLAEIYSVATFYSQFKFKKPGLYEVRICHGTACHISGAGDITRTIEERLQIPAGETTSDGNFSIENVACLGCCSLAPVIMINDRVFGSCTPDSVAKVINTYEKEIPS